MEERGGVEGRGREEEVVLGELVKLLERYKSSWLIDLGERYCLCDVIVRFVGIMAVGVFLDNPPPFSCSLSPFFILFFFFLSLSLSLFFAGYVMLMLAPFLLIWRKSVFKMRSPIVSLRFFSFFDLL